MNQRIRDLAILAEGTKKHVPAVWQFYDHELEQFARLIVRECAQVGEDVDGNGNVKSEILNHFGINP